jgi:hypothetical protein
MSGSALGQGGDLPVSLITPGVLPLHDVDLERFSPLSHSALMAEDDAVASKGVPQRIGVPRKAGFDTTEAGTWETLPSGDQLWRLRVQSIGALWQVAGFGTCQLPPGARLWVYDAGLSKIEGPFGSAGVRDHGQQWTNTLPGEVMVVELVWPANLVGQTPNIHLGLIIHGYRPEVPVDEACEEDCAPDTTCPLDLGIETVNRGVVRVRSLIDMPECGTTGYANCTGALINNTANDCTQYVLTAGHCVTHPGLAPSASFLFNYEREMCCEGVIPEDEEQWVSGATQRMDWDGVSEPALPCFPEDLGGSDTALLEIDEEIPSSFNAFYIGWDRSGSTAGQTGTIHQPSGSKSKKVTVSFDGFEVENDRFWRVPDWEIGDTRGGSSGAPLITGVGALNPARITGVLSAGPVGFCPGVNDTFGRLDAAWNGGGAPNKRLKDWLDPTNTGATTYHGREHLSGVNCSIIPWPDLPIGLAGGGAPAPPGPGTVYSFGLPLENQGETPLTNVVGVLSTSTPGVGVVSSTASWPEISGMDIEESTSQFEIQIDPTVPCGTLIQFELAITSDDGDGAWFPTFVVPVGEETTSFSPVPGPFVSESLEGTNSWMLDSTDDTPIGPRWFVPDIDSRSDTALMSAIIPVFPSNSVMKFRHQYNTENIYGGGVLEYRLGTAGGPWTDAGDLIVEGGYGSGISGEVASDVRGRSAWSGDSLGYQDVVVDGSSLAGQTVQFRFRLVTDDSEGDVGWWIDDAILETTSFDCASTCDFGDLDNDNDVDLVDFAAFQLCFTGSGGGPVSGSCLCADFDADGDVDLVDFAGFQLAFTGSM